MFIGAGLSHYASVLLRWLWLIGLTICICAGSTYAINVFTTPTYEASALVQVHDASTTNNNVFTDQALAQSYALLLNRPTVLAAVVKRMPKLTVPQLAATVSDSPLDNTQIIQVRTTAKDPVLAANITNTVIDVFIKMQVDDETTHLKGVAAKLYKNIVTAKQNISTDQTQLVTLQDAHASQDRIAHQNDVLSSDQVSYNSLLVSYDQVQQQLLQVSNILTIAQVAIPPTKPSSPRTFLNTVVAAALSGLAVIVFVLLLDWIDTSIKTSDDIEQLAQVDSLGSIPFCKTTVQSLDSIYLPLINNDVIKQAFVGINTNTLAVGRGKHSILVTGLRQKSGVSTVAANLAITLAASGMRILLVDANLHNASLHRVFKNANTSGLTTLFTDTDLQDGSAVYSWLHQLSTQVPNLYFLPSGPTTTSMDMLFLSPRIRSFLNNLLQPVQNTTHETPSGLVDVILFDSASLDSTNTLALASFTDASILVIDAGKEDAMMLRKAYTILQRLSCTPLGVIINRQKSKHKSYLYTRPSSQFVPTKEDERAMSIISSSTFRPTHNAQNISPSSVLAKTLATSTYNTSIPAPFPRPMANQNFNQILHMPHTDHGSEKYNE